MVHHEKNFRDMASVWKDVNKGMFLEKFGDPLHQKTCYIISKVMVIFLLKSWKQQWLTLYFLWGFFQKILCLVESVIQQKSHSLIQHQISQLTLSLINHQAKKFLADFFFDKRDNCCMFLNSNLPVFEMKLWCRSVFVNTYSPVGNFSRNMIFNSACAQWWLV